MKTAVTFGGSLGVFVGKVFKPRRAETAATLKRCLPELSEQEHEAIQDGMFRNLGRSFTEIFWYGARGTQVFIDHNMYASDEIQNTLKEHRKEDGKILFLTAHLGNLELFAVLANEIDLPITAVVKRIKGAGASRYINEKRAKFGLKILPAKKSFRECIRAIRQGEMVTMIMDQAQPLKRGVIADFFGFPASTTPGLALLSVQTNTPVLPAFMIRTGLTTHEMKIYAAIEPPPDKRSETIQAYTQRYNNVLEQAIREYPDQWIWMHRRWKNTDHLKSTEAVATP